MASDEAGRVDNNEDEAGQASQVQGRSRTQSPKSWREGHATHDVWKLADRWGGVGVGP
eukprot:CAMPEP_0196661834 /NCGR_PEP_ID=MMETSP1086-20130531/46029_1 /TAXON_ID=77921 /ORGANISM="Cyanoptyche  gloeocystis , Strain SAG4.97" /LENGTH=57 /DNA_ID=CAMNT_0041996919 /DNA_START=205 /DNA_END=375 /DNA_ORIENTATION=+